MPPHSSLPLLSLFSLLSLSARTENADGTPAPATACDATAGRSPHASLVLRSPRHSLPSCTREAPIQARFLQARIRSSRPEPPSPAWPKLSGHSSCSSGKPPRYPVDPWLQFHILRPHPSSLPSSALAAAATTLPPRIRHFHGKKFSDLQL